MDEIILRMLKRIFVFPPITALVSISSLETAMVAQFGKEKTEYFRITMTAFTGIGVSLIVVGMAVFMIIRSSFWIKRDMEK